MAAEVIFAYRDRAFMAEVARWRPHGDSWRLVAYALNHCRWPLLPAPNGARRWTAKLVREEFQRLLPEGMTERAWCVDQLARSDER